MCGILGGQILENTTPKQIVKTLRKLLFTSARRGKDAWGLTFLVKNDYKYSLKTFKSSQSIFKTFDKSEFHDFLYKNHNNQNKIIYVLGHTRMATNGSVLDKNNQPLISIDDNQSLVFNGIIINANKILYKKKTYTFNDGESLWYKNKKENKLKGCFSYIKIQKDNKSISLKYETNNGSLYYSNKKFLALKNILLSEESFFIKNNIFNSKKINLNKIYQSQLVKLDSKNKFIKNNVVYMNDKINSHSNGLVFEVLDKSLSKSLVKKIDNRISYLNQKVLRCKNCILPNTYPFIKFDEKGVCNFCKNEKKAKLKDKKIFERTLNKTVNKYGQEKILSSLSGGRDSSYTLHLLVKEYGIKPLTYTYDWGLNTDIARKNVSIMTGELGVENILISADIRRKRLNVRKNILAWLKKPHVGIVPLFMAGDKQFISNASILKKEKNTKLEVFASNLLEITQFKEEFSGYTMWNPKEVNKHYGNQLKIINQAKLLFFYGKEFLLNPRYLNSSVFDSFRGFMNYYNNDVKPLKIFEYLDWDEKIINNTLKKYDWQFAKDTPTSWRIGDGTAPFYNLIYLLYVGFTENDVIRSNMIRQKKISRKIALQMATEENKIRYPSLIWYLKLFNLDPDKLIREIVKKSWNYGII